MLDFSNTRESVLSKVRDTIILRFEAEAELLEIDVKDKANFLNQKIASVADYKQLSLGKLNFFLKEQKFELDFVEKKLKERKIYVDKSQYEHSDSLDDYVETLDTNNGECHYMKYNR